MRVSARASAASHTRVPPLVTHPADMAAQRPRGIQRPAPTVSAHGCGEMAAQEAGCYRSTPVTQVRIAWASATPNTLAASSRARACRRRWQSLAFARRANAMEDVRAIPVVRVLGCQQVRRLAVSAAAPVSVARTSHIKCGEARSSLAMTGFPLPPGRCFKERRMGVPESRIEVPEDEVDKP